MKKIFNYFFVVLAAGLMLTACKKGTDAPVPEPEPEPEEPEQYADYVLKMDVEYYYDLGYDGVKVDYADFVTEDKEHLWDIFGYEDEAEFIAALGTLSEGFNSGDVKFVAFDASTEYINESGCNTNGWGNWFSAAGDVINWGDDAYFFTEGQFPDNADLTATLGSYPGHLTAENDGQEFRIIQGFADNDISVACEFLITVTTEAPEIELNFVGEATGEVTLPMEYSYARHELAGLDKDAAAAALGFETLEEASAYGVYHDGSYTVSAGADIWYDLEGNPGSWGDNASVGMQNDETYGWTFCLMPNDTIIGGTYAVTIAFVNANNDAYKYTLNVTVTEPEEVELNFIGVDSASVTVPYDSTYYSYALPFDSAKIATALGTDPQTLSAYGFNPDGTQTSYSGTNFWFLKDGTIGEWADENAAICIENPTGRWQWCMRDYKTLIGGTYQGIIALYNENNDAYLFKLEVKITE